MAIKRRVLTLLLGFMLIVLQGCQRNEEKARIPINTIPYPADSKDKHTFVDQPDPDYYEYIAYARCTVDEQQAEIFLKQYGFEQNEVGLTTALPHNGLPKEIKFWWTPPEHNGSMLRSKRLSENGYAQALVADGKLYLFCMGNIRELSHVKNK